MIVDISYFRGALSIPNIGKDEESFNTNYIERYEKEILIKLLGYDLYKRFTDGLLAAPTAIEWLQLRDGHTYDVIQPDETVLKVRWNGLANIEKDSLIAYYIYNNYVRNNYQQLTGLGVTAQTPENAVTLSPNEKLIWSNNSLYLLASDNTRLAPSLCNFLTEFKATYTGWIYTPVVLMNIFDV